jgi:DNA polymerase
MPNHPLDSNMRAALSAHIAYYRELGIHDFYRRPVPEAVQQLIAARADEEIPGKPDFGLLGQEPASPANRTPVSAEPTRPLQPGTSVDAPDHVAALRAIRADLGDCTRCPLHTMGRKQIVFGTGNPYAELMFVGEAPGADEDQQGEPFVGRAGQLLNNMIAAMGLKREQVYIGNVIKCRPPGNRTPTPEECAICSPFVVRQIEAISPKVIVALGAVAAKTLLGVSESMGALRGRWYQFRDISLAVTYHPAYLLRNPAAKKDAWQDLQMVMKRLGLKVPKKG